MQEADFNKLAAAFPYIDFDMTGTLWRIAKFRAKQSLPIVLGFAAGFLIGARR